MNIVRGLTFSKAQLIELYNDAGWHSYLEDEGRFWQTIERSSEHFSIFENEKLIGYARILGDCIHTVLIQDLIIRSEYQRKNIGSRLLKCILYNYQEVRQILILCDNEEGLIEFYKKNGLNECDKYGCKCFIKMK